MFVENNRKHLEKMRLRKGWVKRERGRERLSVELPEAGSPTVFYWCGHIHTRTPRFPLSKIGYQGYAGEARAVTSLHYGSGGGWRRRCVTSDGVASQFVPRTWGVERRF